MPYPQPPEIQTTYQSVEQALGDGTLPGQELDVDLAAIRASMTALIEFVKGITRSDGRLANGSVTTDTLASSILIGFDPPTPWQTGTAYTTKSTVFEGYGFYLCVTAHTSGVFATDLASSRWVLLADLTPPGGALIAANNLSDVGDASNARSNLGLGSMATAASGTGAAQHRTNIQNDAVYQAILTGLTASVAELNHTIGVTSPIQTQLNAKQAAGATLTSLEGLSLAAGDVLYATAADTLARLPAGTNSQSIKQVSGVPAWQNTVTPVTASGGTLTDLTTTFTNRLSVSFVATGVSAVLTAGVSAQHQSATATDVLGELRIYDTVALADVATSAGGETATANIGYAVRYSLPVSINTLVPGRTYEAQLWLRKTVFAGPTLPRDLRIDGFTA